MTAAVTFSIQGNLAGVESWTEFAQACERDGFDTLLVPDHPGACAAPLVTLAAAAARIYDPFQTLPSRHALAMLDLGACGRK